PVFWLEVAVIATVVLAYLSRRPALRRADAPLEVILPLVATALPFGLALGPAGPRIAPAIGLTMSAGLALSLAGLLSLRRSFSILVEVRDLVVSGPYRWLRHPIYAGEIVACAGVLALRFSALTAAVFAAFVAVQVARALLEERKLSRALPAYAEYAKRTWRFVPAVW
ncbi:MAG TPA: isoprenylcysteine carboxylmethyltransferase family protein, partial [Planctomycetota bacterium]|nr:isoprenylcysteine carboxylmethyltransferase family protein [Planctomycetota bacterium]